MVRKETWRAPLWRVAIAPKTAFTLDVPTMHRVQHSHFR
jgi:hypothetical protein